MANNKLIFGEIENVDSGDIFDSRKELNKAGVHGPTMGGIWGRENEGACSIVLSGGYEDDIDNLDYILYTGHGGQDSPGGKQVTDQVFRRGNLGLKVSCDMGYPVRVIRGFQIKHGPDSGYRYDGLYEVSSYERTKGKNGFFVCRFHLNRLENQKKITKKLTQKNQPSERLLKSLRIEGLEELFKSNVESWEDILFELNYRNSDRSKRLATNIKLKRSFNKNILNKNRIQEYFYIDDESLLELDVVALDFKVRTLNCLVNEGVQTVGDICKYSEKDLLDIPNFGSGCLREIENKFESLINKGSSGFIDLNKKNPWKLNKELDLALPITKLYFSARTLNCLNSVNIETVKDLVDFGKSRLLKTPNFGKKTLMEVEQRLSEISLGSERIELSGTQERILTPRSKFINNKRNSQILFEWNTRSSTLEDIGKKYDITREAVRQILGKAKKLDLEVLDNSSKSEMRSEEKSEERIRKVKRYLEEHKDEFFKTYKKTKNLKEISDLLSIQYKEVKEIEDYLIEIKEIERPLSRSDKFHGTYQPSEAIKQRRDEVLILKGKKKTIKEIADILGVSKPTVCNDVRYLKGMGIEVPFTQESGRRLSEEEIDLRSNFIRVKSELGWTYERIAINLGLKGHEAISRHIVLYMKKT